MRADPRGTLIKALKINHVFSSPLPELPRQRTAKGAPSRANGRRNIGWCGPLPASLAPTDLRFFALRGLTVSTVRHASGVFLPTTTTTVTGGSQALVAALSGL